MVTYNQSQSYPFPHAESPMKKLFGSFEFFYIIACSVRTWYVLLNLNPPPPSALVRTVDTLQEEPLQT